MLFLFLGSFGTSRRLCQSSSACEPILDDFALFSSFFTRFSSHVFGDVSRAEGPLQIWFGFPTQRSNQLSGGSFDPIWIQLNGPSSYFTPPIFGVSWYSLDGDFVSNPLNSWRFPLLETKSAVRLTWNWDCKGCPGCQPYIAHTNHTTLGCFLPHGKSHHPKWSHSFGEDSYQPFILPLLTREFEQWFNFQENQESMTINSSTKKHQKNTSPLSCRMKST